MLPGAAPGVKTTRHALSWALGCQGQRQTPVPLPHPHPETLGQRRGDRQLLPWVPGLCRIDLMTRLLPSLAFRRSSEATGPVTWEGGFWGPFP